MEKIEIGRTGRPHGIKGELGLNVNEEYLDDLLNAPFVMIGVKPVPYPVQRFVEGGKLRVKLARFESREQVVLLSNKPLWLPADRVTVEDELPETPWDWLIGYRVEAEGYPMLGPIERIMDLPNHYLAEIVHASKTVYLPLHEDLVIGVREEDTILVMDLPGGLLEL